MAASWFEQEAERVAQRVERRGGGEALFETGYGPSGLPHLGTFAEVARTSFVRWALAEGFPGIRSRLIAFSDDMDGLRSVPQNIPGGDALAEHLGRPLSRIPDPFGTAASFSDHMVGRLKEFLGGFGFDATFLSSSDCYASGRFDEGLARLLAHTEAVKQIVLPTLQPQTRETWHPFLPLCEACGRYTTRVTGEDAAAATVTYACDQEFGGAAPCGHRGETSVTGGRAKVGWKIDWALRWMVLGVDYEMYGKDLIESADISARICRALGHEPPIGFFYELFLDEEGRKISKKIGNGVALDDWLAIAPDDSVLHFLSLPPKKARRIGLELCVRNTDGFLGMLRSPEPDGSFARMAEAIAPKIDRKHGWRWSSDVDFALLVALVPALGLTDRAAVLAFIDGAEGLQIGEGDRPFLEELVSEALAYTERTRSARDQPRTPLEGAERAAAEAFRAALSTADFADAEGLQNLSFEAGKDAGVPLRAWFGVLYRALVDSSSGPRLGTLLRLLGRERALARLDAALQV